MTSIYTKVNAGIGWKLRASFDETLTESASWLSELKEYFEHSGEEVRIQSDAPALAALGRVLDYVEPEESKHYEENDGPADHIYHDVCAVRDWHTNTKGRF